MPTISCPDDTSVGYNSGDAFYTLPDYVLNEMVDSSDNCTENPTIVQTPVAGTELIEGTYTISFEAEDSEGNSQNCSFQLTVMEVLSNNNITFENSIKVFPVPALNEINITSKDKSIKVIEIYDLMGKKVFAENNISSKEKTINISSFSNGMYFLSINNKATKKIIKK